MIVISRKIPRKLVRVNKSGGTLKVSIPQECARLLGLGVGDILEVFVEEGKLVYKKIEI